ncbi:MAG: hypothetical protein P1V18_03135 [Candidatus Gracilibacteria bacterium]|nr:hypothetical protein [Candidatus Gracilibacteria bacterium]
MDERQFLLEYRSTRIFVSFCFAMMMMVIGIISGYNHSDVVGSFAVQAFENPSQVFSSAIKGMAQ